jgi:hypothetical protein
MSEQQEIRTNVPKYVEIEYNGQIARQYQDGSIRNSNGHMLAPLDNGEYAITPETARYMHSLRKQKILNAIESKLKDVTKTNIPADAIAAIVGKRAEIAMKDDTRTGNEAAKIVLAAVDAYQDKQTEQTTVTRNEYVMDADTMAMLERILESRRENVLDATVMRSDDENMGE